MQKINVDLVVMSNRHPAEFPLDFFVPGLDTDALPHHRKIEYYKETIKLNKDAEKDICSFIERSAKQLVKTFYGNLNKTYNFIGIFKDNYKVDKKGNIKFEYGLSLINIK